METLVNGFIKLLFFFGKYLEDEAFLLIQLRISILGTFNYSGA